MSRTTASRSTWAVLATLGILLLASSARGGLVLQLSSSSSSIDSSMTITAAGTYTFYLYVEVSDGAGSSYSGNALSQIAANIVSTSNSFLSTTGTSGISGFTVDASLWQQTHQNGTANTALGVAGVQSWGSNTSASGDIVGINTSGATQATALQAGGGNGLAVNSSTWAFLVGTATLTINDADLLGGTGTVDYVAQLTTQSAVKAKWWQTNKGATVQQIYGTATSNATSGLTQSPDFVITYEGAGTALMTMSATGTTSQTIIEGGTATFTTTVGNSGSEALSYGVSAAGSGVLAGTSSSFSNAALAPSGSDPLSLVVGGSAVPGSGTLTWHVTSSTGGTPGDVVDTLTVLAHAAPSLTATGTDIGRVLGGATVSVATTLGNADNPSGATRADLQVTGLSGTGLTQTAGPAVNDKVHPNESAATLTALVNTSTASYAPGSFTISVADDQAYAGAGATPLADQTLTVSGTIGWASAPSSSTFGAALTATVNGSAGGTGNPLFSRVDVAASPGALGTRASLLGSGSTSGPVTMAWRQATGVESSGPVPLISDVVQLGGSGMPEGLTYVLQMSFDPAHWAVAGHVAELSAAGRIYLVSDASGTWRNAVLDDTLPAGTNALTNFQGSYQDYLSAAGSPALATQLGSWGVGVDPTTGQDVVWAVLNHASDFAVVPEPATMAFLLLGGLGLTATALRRAKRGTNHRSTSSS